MCLPEDDFLVIGSDGVFDAASIQDLAKIIRAACKTLSEKSQMLKEIKSEPEIKTFDGKAKQLQMLARSEEMEKRGRIISHGGVQKGGGQSQTKVVAGTK